MPATGPWTYTPGADVPDDDRRVTIPASGLRGGDLLVVDGRAWKVEAIRWPAAPAVVVEAFGPLAEAFASEVDR